MKKQIIILCLLFCVLLSGCQTSMEYKACAVTKEYAFDTVITDVKIVSSQYRIKLLLSDNDMCSVVCKEADASFHTVKCENNTLSIIKEPDTKKNINFNGVELEIDVYLPKNEYGVLEAESSSGSISAGYGLSFGTVKLETSSGCVALENINAGSADIETSSGSIELNGVTAVSCGIKSSSGNVGLRDSDISGTLTVDTSSGDVHLNSSDAGNISIETSSGDIDGTFTDDKLYSITTSSGTVNVPDSVGERECIIKTSSGDISIKKEKQ